MSEPRLVPVGDYDCDGCDVGYDKQLVEVGQDRAVESFTARLCHACLKKALKLLEGNDAVARASESEVVAPEHVVTRMTDRAWHLAVNVSGPGIRDTAEPVTRALIEAWIEGAKTGA